MTLPTLQQTIEDQFSLGLQRRHSLCSMTPHRHPAEMKRLYGPAEGNGHSDNSPAVPPELASSETFTAASEEVGGESQPMNDDLTPQSLESLDEAPVSINEVLKAYRRQMEERGKQWLRQGPFPVPDAELHQIISESYSALNGRILQWVQTLPTSEQSNLTSARVSVVVRGQWFEELNRRYVEWCIARGKLDRSANYHFRGLQPADAEDLFQESVLKTLQHREKIRPRGVSSYIGEVLWTRLQDLRRKRTRMARPSSEVDPVARDHVGNQQKATTICDAIEQAIQEMPPDQQPMIRVWLEALEGGNDADNEE